MSFLKLLGSTSFLMANKEIIKLTDIETAILYSDLAGAQDYWSEKSDSQDGYFYRTQNEIEQNTTLSAKIQLRCLRLLEEKGLIKTKLKGLPAKKYFCIDSDCKHSLLQILQNGETYISETDNQDEQKSTNKVGENVQTRLAISDNQDSTKRRTNNNKVNNNKEVIINNENRINKESYSFENAKYHFEVTQVLSLLTKLSGVNYKIPKTKLDFEKYEPYKLIKERIKEKATLEDIIAIVEMKNKEWQGTHIYKNFIPSTLFRKSNFDKYLQQLQIQIKQPPKPETQEPEFKIFTSTGRDLTLDPNYIPEIGW